MLACSHAFSDRFRLVCLPCFAIREYRAGLRKLGSFNTIESFWKHYLYMKRPSHLENNVNLYLFRDGPNMAPMWEVRRQARLAALVVTRS